MHVVIQPSPSVTHKLRVTLPNMRAIDFGDRSVQHYPDHEIHREMMKIDKSSKEDWDDYYGAEYWERWILWTYPNINKAKLYMTMRHGMLFMPRPEDLWFIGP